MRRSPLERSRFRGLYLVLLTLIAGVFLFIALQESISMKGSRTAAYLMVALGVAAGVALILVLAPYQRRWREGGDTDTANPTVWSWISGGLVGASALLLTVGGAPTRVAVFSFMAGVVGAAPPTLAHIYRSDA